MHDVVYANKADNSIYWQKMELCTVQYYFVLRIPEIVNLSLLC